VSTAATADSARLLLDERERAAWAQYADTLRTLGSVSYAQAEPPAWEHLQEELTQITRAKVDTGAADTPSF